MKGTRVTFILCLSLFGLLLSTSHHDSFSMLIDYDTGCPHDHGPNLFTGERYGWPFYFIYIGYIERCTTIEPIIPDIRFAFLPGLTILSCITTLAIIFESSIYRTRLTSEYISNRDKEGHGS